MTEKITYTSATRKPNGTKWTYLIDGHVMMAASKVDYKFVSLTWLVDIPNDTNPDKGKPIISFHKTEAAAAKGAGGYFTKYTKSIKVLPITEEQDNALQGHAAQRSACRLLGRAQPASPDR